MKSLRFVGLVVVVFALALVWRATSRRAVAAASEASPRPVATAPATAPAAPRSAPTPVAASSATVAPAAPALFGARGPVTLDEVPAGRFREQLLKLEPVARTRALAALERLRIPHNDVEALATDVDGHLYYECARELAGSPPLPAALPVTSAAPVAIANPPVRHSRPGASRVLYLDFNGHNVVDTGWNAANPGVGRPAVATYACRPYDKDGDATTFSDTEQAQIVEIWQRVAEDYSAFDVDVTTEKPAVFTSQTLRALITPTVDANGVSNPSSATASGVAYIDIYGRDSLATYSPAFVYYDALSGPTSVADVVSHELGHNLALSHDGTSTKSYYSGHGTGEFSWGPIMGAPSARTVTQWSKGEYFDANNPQDDLAIIGVSLTLRTDGVGNSLATATNALNSGNDVSVTDVLRGAGESKYHRIVTAAGRVGFSVTPTTYGNSDLRLDLLDSAGNAVAMDDPAATRIGGVFTANPVAAGIYYLKVTASGMGTPLVNPPTGYTSYGSIGQYTLAGTVVAAPPVIIGSNSASAAVGHSFLYQTVTAGDASSFGATGLPPGVTLDATTGILSGRPTATGVYSVTLSATNSIGTGTATLTLTVNDAVPALTASSAPAVVLAPAESATLSVTGFSVNGAIGYQWFRNGRAIAGATGATYNVSGATERGLAAYWVTLTNTVGTTRSAPFFVRAAPSITKLVAWGGNNASRQTAVPAGLGRVVDVAAGPSHSAALRADGSVVQWGYWNGPGDVTVNDAVALAAGSDFTVALRSNGTVTVLGAAPALNQKAAVLRDVVAVAAGSYHAVALKSDGTVVTWNGSSEGLVPAPGGITDAVAIAAGYHTTHILKADGSVVGWGDSFAAPPVALTGVKTIAAGANRALALKSGGTTVAWVGGTATPGVLNDESSLAVGAAGSYAIAPDGTVTAWDTSSAALAAPAGLANVVRLSVGGDHVLALCDAASDSVPAITVQPAPALRAVGDAHTFRVTASGPGALAYQWRKYGTPLAGATTSSLTLDPLRDSDAGTYDVVVSNHAGAMTSSGALLTLEPPPAIVSRPARAIEVSTGTSVQLAFTASSANAPLTYQWKKDNRPLPGAMSPVLTIDAFGTTDAGAYVLEITDAHGLVTRALTFLRPALGRTQVTVWGSPYYGVTDVPRDLGDAVAAGVGASAGAAVRANGSIVAWGQVDAAVRPKIVAVADAVSVAVVGNRIFALRSNGRVSTWDAAGNETSLDFVDVIAVASSGNFGAALLADGSVRTWGGSTPPVAPGELRDVVAISAGSSHVLALRRDGTVAAFGSNGSGQCNVPVDLNGVVAVAAGGSHSLALKGAGTVVGWGGGGYGESTPPTDLGLVTAIAAGANFSTAQRAGGTLEGWGVADYDYRRPPAEASNLVALGAGSLNPFMLRRAPADAGPVVTRQPVSIATAAGVPQRFAVQATGAGLLGYQWRRNGVAIPGATTALLELPNPQAANVGSYDVVITNHVASITSMPATLSIVDPPAIAGGSPQFLVVAPGEYLRLTVSANSPAGPLAYQWKRNNRPLPGATGANLTFRQFTPADAGAYTVEVTDARGAVSRRTSFVVADPGPTQVQTWGSTTIEAVPADLGDVWAVRGGSNMVLALRRSGAVVGWGGYGNFSPNPTGLDQPAVDAVAFSTGAIALRADGTPFGWGNQNYLGSYPKVPANLRDVIALAATGDSTVYALRSDGRVYSWGAYNGLAAVPLDLPPITAIAAGYSQVLMLGIDGKVYVYGSDTYGTSNVPAGLSDVTTIGAGQNHFLAVKGDGTVVAWGSNTYGQSAVPVDLGDVVSVGGSYYNSFAVRRDGTTRVWGTSTAAVANQPVNLSQVIGAVLPGDGAVVLRRSAGDLAPVINRSPVAVGLKRVGDSAVFDVVASGSGRLGYQWRRDGVAIANATLATLTLTDLQPADAGLYDVVVRNHVGAVTSATTRLDVAVAPTIVTAPPRRVVAPLGAPLTLSGSATSAAGPLSYRWKKNNRPIAGATSPALSLPNITRADAGAYTLEVTDAAGLVSRATSFVVPSGTPTRVRAWGLDSDGQLAVPEATLSDAVSVVADAKFALVLRADGTVVGWGKWNAFGLKLTVPAGLADVVAIAAAQDHALALRSDGTVRVWSAYGDIPVPTVVRGAIAITAAGNYASALRDDGSVVTWNLASSPNAVVDTGSFASADIVAVKHGIDHMLVLRGDGTVGARAFNTYSSTPSLVEVPAGLAGVAAIAAGGSQSLALKTDGSIVAWGANRSRVAIGAGGATAVVGGPDASAALLADGTLATWTSSTDYFTPPADLGPVLDFALGYYHMVAIVDHSTGAVPVVTQQPASGFVAAGDTFAFRVAATSATPMSYQWRKNGQPIAGATSATLALPIVREADAGSYDVVVANAAGSVTSQAATLTLADGPQVTNVPPARLLANAGANVTLTVAAESPFGPLTYRWKKNNRPIAGANAATFVATNFDPTQAGAYTCEIIDSRGVVSRATSFVLPARGRTQYLAFGVSSNSGLAEAPAAAGDSLIELAAGSAHMVGLRADGTVVAWGNNSSRQTDVPAGLANVVAIAASGYGSMALKADGTIVTWGRGSTTGASVAGLDGVIAIAMAEHFVALRSNGTVVAWTAPDGYDSVTPPSSAVVTVPANLTDVVHVAAAYNLSLAVKADGTAIAWGSGTDSRANRITDQANLVRARVGSNAALGLRADGTVVNLGNSSSSSSQLPAGLAQVTELALGEYHGVALKTNGSLVGWGSDQNGSVTSLSTVGNAFAISAIYGFTAVLRDANADVAPTIATPPANIGAELGGNATFSVKAAGAGPFRFQWRKDGVAIPRATSATLVVPAVTSVDVGSYDVVVSNHIGSTTSAPATLTVGTGGSSIFATVPATRQVAALGQPLTLSFALRDTSASYTYRWYRNAQLLVGANSLAYTISSVDSRTAGAFTLEVSDANGVVARQTTFVLLDYGRTRVRAWGNAQSNRLAVPVELGDALAVSAGSVHALALRRDGTVVAWGSNDSGQATVPVGLNSVVAISAGGSHSLALRADGTVVSWGSSGGVVPSGLNNVIAISADSNRNIVLKSDGTVVAWSYSGVASLPELRNVVAIAAGSDHYLMLQTDGTVVAWTPGPVYNGQATLPAGLGKAASISASSSQSAAVTADGTVFVWGEMAGQVALGQVPSPTIECGYRVGVVLAGDGRVMTWGDASYGARDVPADLGSVLAVSAGNSFLLALCSAQNDTGPTISVQPQEVLASPGAQSVFRVVATGSGTLSYQWRFNGTPVAGANADTLVLDAVSTASAGSYDVVVSNHVGSVTSAPATLTFASAPTVTTAPPARVLGVGGQSLTLMGAATTEHGPLTYRWKKNNRPIVGATAATLTLPSFTNADAGAYTLEITDARGLTARVTTFVLPDYSPTEVVAWGNAALIPAGLGDVIQPMAGANYSAALKRNGSVAVWGNSQPVQMQAGGLDNVVALAGYGYDLFALRAEGTLRALVDGSSVSSSFLAGLEGVISFVSGPNFAVALKSDGTVAVGGSMSGAKVYQDYRDFVAVAAGEAHALGLRVDGSVVAWGSNSLGQTTVPAGLTNVVAIAAGASHSVALRADGSVVAWGNNSSGQATVPSGLANVTSIVTGQYATGYVKADGTMVVVGDNGWGLRNVPTGLNAVISASAGYYHMLALRTAGGDALPQITTQPQSPTVARGSRVVLTVAATHPRPFTYQWRRSGVAISGATSATLEFASAQDTDSGDYDVVVTGTVGAATSAVARLTVAAPPTIVSAPEARQLIALGAPLTLTVTASTENGPLAYQWRKNNRVIPGATSATFALANFGAADAGAYTLEIRDARGVVARSTTFVLPAYTRTQLRAWGESTNNRLAVPAIADAIAVVAGSNHSLALRADGTVVAWGFADSATNVPADLTDVVAIACGGYYSMALRKDGTVRLWGNNYAIPAAVAPALKNVIAISAGNLALALRADGVIVAFSPTGNTQPGDTPPTIAGDVVAIAAGDNQQLALTAAGSIVFWSRYSTTTPGELTDVTAIAAGGYSYAAVKSDGRLVTWGYYTNGAPGFARAVSAGDYYGVAQAPDGALRFWGAPGSIEAAIPMDLGTVLAFSAGRDHVVALRDASGDSAPSIVAEPQSAARSAGAAYTFTVAATGTGPFAYQWLKDGVPLAGANSPQLTLAQITPADAGNYSARVSNHVGSRTTAVATLTVLNLPVVTSRPATRVSVVPGQPVTLTASATTANTPLRYQWKKNNRPIAGATTAALTLPAFAFADAGAYTLEIVDALGATARVTSFLAPTGVATQVRTWSSSTWPAEDPVPVDLADAIKVVRSMNYSLALRATGRVVGWGGAGSFALPAPVGLEGVVDLAAAGDRNVIALTSDQKIFTWGADYPTPTTATEVIGVAAGANHYLALRADGTVVAWGANSSGQCDVPAGLANVVAIAAASDSSAALLLDASVVVWGTLRNALPPVGFSGAVEVALAQNHVLTRKADGTVVAWGSGSYGETNVPANLAGAVRIAAAYGLSFAVKGDGTVTGWGNGSALPVPTDLTDVMQIAADQSRAIALRFSANDAAPALSAQPTSQSLALGARAIFTVTATGTGPLSYQWRRGGVPISGATGTTFVIGAVVPGDAASYDVVVTNHRGSVTSTAAVLTVNSPPTITGGSATRLAVAPGQCFSLAVTATSPNGPLTYRWKKDNRLIAGATSATYSRPGFTVADAGAYTVEVSDAAGRVSRRTTFVLPTFSATQLVAFGASGSYSLVTPPASLGSPLVAVTAGDSFNAVLRADGTVAAWGYNGSGETNVPAGLADVVAISSRRSYTLALKSDGTVIAWGWNNYGARTPPSDLREVIAIAAGPNHALALKSDGTVVTWGYQSTGSLAVPVDMANVVAIAAGSDYSFAVKADGTAVGWGSYNGNIPTGPVAQSDLARVSADYYCAVAVKSDGTLTGWGSNGWSQLTFPSDLSGVADVAVSYYHVLARRGDGTVAAWGRNYSNEATAPAGLGNVFAIAVGNERSLVLRDASADGAPVVTTAPQSFAVTEGNTVPLSVVAAGVGPLSYQWRKDGVAIAGATSASLTLSQTALQQAGRYDVVVSNHVGSVTSAAATVSVYPLPAIAMQSARRNVASPGGSVRLSVTASGTGTLSYQWFRHGRAIAGATSPALDLTNLTRGDAGWYFCAVTDAIGTRRAPTQWVIVAPERTQVLAWGSSESAKTAVPAGLDDAVAVAAGSGHSLAIRRDGSLVGWGASNHLPSPNASVGGVVAATGVSDGLVTLHNDGSVRAWGYYNSVPPGLSEVVAVAGAYGNVLALRADGTVAYWSGYYSDTAATVPPEVRDIVGIAVSRSGYLGLKSDGTLTTWGGSPVTIPAGLNGVTALAAGSDHWLALRTDGTVTAWGSNGSGQTNVPTGLADVVAISATANSSFALKRDGTIVAWGSDTYGEVSGAANRSDVWALATASSATHQLALRASGSDTAPVVMTPPSSVAVAESTRASFTVVANGPGPLAYQWQKNGMAIVGATANSFAIENAQLSDAGSYRVVVTNHIGVVTSAAANLIVEAAPVFTQRPAERLAGTHGAAITLAGAATSANAPITYQWKKDNRAIAGATSPSYTIPSFSNADAGAYTLVATDTRGNAAYATTFILPAYGTVQLRQWGGSSMRVSTNVGQVIDIASNGYATVIARLDGTLMGWSSSIMDVAPASSTPVVRVAMRNGHLLRLHADGKVTTWGPNNYGQSDVPGWLRDVIAVAAGDNHSLALRADGTVSAWGDNRKGQATVPAGLNNVVALAASGDFSAALKADGSVVAWGDNYYGQSTVPAGLTGVVQLIAGSYHFLARKSNGTVVAWGGNQYGETTVPANLTDVVEVAAGSYGSIARRADGSVAIWGQNFFGTTPTAAELGTVHRLTAAGTTVFALRDATNDAAPIITTHPVAFPSASTGNTYTFTVAATGAGPLSYQWRKNGSAISYETNATLNLYYVSDSAAGTYDVVVTNHVGSVTSNAAPLTFGTVTAISTTTPRRQIGVVGQPLELSIVPATSGTWTYQWKKNGRPLAGATATAFTLASFTNADAGAYTLEATSGSTVTRLTFFVLPDFAFTRVWAWGQGSAGQTTPPSGLIRAIAVAAGDAHSLALQRDGTVSAWGANLANQTTVPDRVVSAVAIAAGANHSLALLSDGTVVGWGANNYGQTGVSSSLSGVTAIAAGANHSLALRHDGSVVMWGYNSYSTPSLNNAVAVAAGAVHSLALRTDGTVVAWGENTYNQTTVPNDLVAVAAIAAGNHHSLALKTDGTVVAWGRNHAGQATVPPALSGVVAIAAAADYSLALKSDGTLVSWGDLAAGVGAANYFGVPFALAAGGRHAVALTDDSTTAAPSILAHPQGEAVRAAATISLRVQATGPGTLAYRWYRNGLALVDTATRAGAQTPTLTLASFASADAGDYTVVVSNANGSVTSVAAVLTLEKTPQTITFAPLADREFSATTLTLAATSSSGLPVSFELVSGPAQLSGSTLTLSAAGQITLRAKQLGNETYAAAAPVERTFTVGKATASVSLGNLTATFDGAPKSATATTTPGDLGITVTYNGWTPAPIGAGTYAVTATIADARFVGTATATLTIEKAGQTVTFAGPADQAFTPTPLTLGATATSGLEVIFSVISGPAAVTGDSLQLLGNGAVTVRASQAGDENYLAAFVDRTFVVGTTFDGWRLNYFTAAELLDATISGPNADPDADGCGNLMEYALGTNPRAGSSASAPVMAMAGGNWTFTYTRPTDRADLTYAVEFSTNLTTWSSIGVTHTQISSDGVVETWRATYPVGSAASCFFRLVVTR